MYTRKVHACKTSRCEETHEVKLMDKGKAAHSKYRFRCVDTLKYMGFASFMQSKMEKQEGKDKYVFLSCILPKWNKSLENNGSDRQRVLNTMVHGRHASLFPWYPKQTKAASFKLPFPRKEYP